MFMKTEEQCGAVLFILVRPFSWNMYRRINRVVAEFLWLELVWLFDWWANIKRAGCLGSALAIMKKSSKFLPSGFEHLKDFPRPFWLALFVEGTRFTQEKLLAAQEYAASAGLPVPRNVLVPRTKGFVLAVNHMRSFVPAIYDATVAIPINEPRPTLLRILRGRSSVIHVHIKRHLMEELPETNSGIAQWCKDMFVAKDALLEQHLVNDTFGDKDCQDIGRPKKSLFVVIAWSCLLVYGSIKFFEWFSILPPWEVFTLCATFLAIVMILMQVLIVFSQSEHSTPPPVVSPEDPLKANLLQ
ncbi:hypothetical protein RHGRI_038088 [Rhododendron griersonianum]|uniref:1-acylglycerol-3-phosphate O-acyltransferase n=1 Tax=Rhododendron griersonianum TaxID=479676 RepID=A0AAV6HXI7_9ERIC|nr:hypothetical protein RHGRI_038088 [Rhododendron griersonianum]